jgi:hypothetical protein
VVRVLHAAGGDQPRGCGHQPAAHPAHQVLLGLPQTGETCIGPGVDPPALGQCLRALHRPWLLVAGVCVCVCRVCHVCRMCVHVCHAL